MEMTVRKIVAACGGKLLCGDPDTVVTSVVTDSREVADGSLFVPLKGEKTDAHTFLHAAFASGATAACIRTRSSAPCFSFPLPWN
ncbi:MAG: Mur ligase domain-containing protein [Dehalobacterium sp.]